MRRVIGNYVRVMLKKSETSMARDLYGMLIDVSDDSLYVQCPEGSDLFVIPKENVCYCITDSMPVADRHVIKSCQNEEATPVLQNKIDVFVNGELFTSIDVEPTIPISVWNESIARIIGGNPDVQHILHGKIKKEIKYEPGKVSFAVEDVPQPEQNNSFSVSLSSPTTTILSPGQMIERLNNVGRIIKDGK